ncbi:MAG: hypothetical protein IKL18_01570 [Oscillospiraceae bacterium]|nr:hypothetical protein [Oscillospiraceae bacterium]
MKPGGKAILKTVADPERQRSGLEIARGKAVRFVPLIGDSGCGSNAGVEVFFQAQPGFFLKRNGVVILKNIIRFVGFSILHFIYIIKFFSHKPFLVKSIEKKRKNG